MKLKGINFFEANADKIVLGVTGITFLGALAMQFLGGNYIKVGSVEKLTPGSAYVPVEDEAKKLVAKLNAESPKLPDPPVLTLTEKLEGLAGKALSVDGVRVALGPPPLIQTASLNVAVAAATYALPAMPVPSPAVAAPYSATVSPVELALHPELATILPKEQPLDKMIVSVESSFDGAALRDALLADPDGAGPQEAIPLAWWRDPLEQGDDLVTIVGVEAERELIRNPDGTTPSTPTTGMVDPAPARLNGVATWTEGVRSLGDVPPMISTLRSEQEQVLRPKFYQTIAGPAWTSPLESASQGDSNEKSRQVKLKRQALANLDKRIATVQDLASKAPEPTSRRPGESSQPVEAPRGGQGRGSGKGGGPSGPASKTNEGPKGDKRALEAQLKNLGVQRQRLVDELTKLGERVEGSEGANDSNAVLQGALPGLLEGGEQKVWVHDVKAEPGAMYRYRVRVVINSPVFGRNLQETQKGMADASLVRSEWSEWSAPVMVDRERVLFVSSAQEAGDLNPRPHASVELYQFYYGYYRQAAVGLDPGEPAQGTAKLPELKLAAMSKLKTLVENGDPSLGVLPSAADPAPGPTGGGGGGKGAGGRGPAGRERGRQGGGPEEVAPVATNAESKFPAWMNIDGPKTLALGGNLTFLDASVVPASPGQTIGATQALAAIFRDEKGLLMVRRPDKERQDPYFARVEASAKAGQTQGIEIKPVETPAQAPRPRDQRSTTPVPGGGGGGGGGG